MKTRTAIALAVLLAATSARAADVGALSVEVATTVMPKATYEQIMSAVGTQMQQTLPQVLQKMELPGVDAEEGAALMKELGPVLSEEYAKLLPKMMPSYQEMADLQAGILAKHYTADELQKLLEFYQSPVGKKAVRIMPEVTQDAMGWMQRQMMDRMPAAMKEFQAAVQAKVEEYARKHAKKQAK